MDEKVEPAPKRLDLLENRVDRGRVGHVAMAGDMRLELRGERLDALLERVPLVGERKLRARRADRGGDAPGERTVVGDAHDQAPLAAHHSAHRRFHPVLSAFFDVRQKPRRHG